MLASQEEALSLIEQIELVFDEQDQGLSLLSQVVEGNITQEYLQVLKAQLT